MQAYYYPTLVTLLIALVYFWMALTVARTHARTGILAPTMTGGPVLERTYRAHVNTLEWMPIPLPSMWAFAVYWSPTVAALLGLLWIVGRVIYFVGYISEAKKRFPGFFIQATAAFVLLLGALGRIIYLMATNTETLIRLLNYRLQRTLFLWQMRFTAFLIASGWRNL